MTDSPLQSRCHCGNIGGVTQRYGANSSTILPISIGVPDGANHGIGIARVLDQIQALSVPPDNLAGDEAKALGHTGC